MFVHLFPVQIYDMYSTTRISYSHACLTGHPEMWELNGTGNACCMYIPTGTLEH